jgi:hypothetical protein
MCAWDFFDELSKHGRDFKVYRVPINTAVSINKMELVDDRNYALVRQDVICSSTSAPSSAVLVWSVWPRELDKAGKLQGEESTVRASSTPSIYKQVKEDHRYKCQACKGDYSQNTVALDAAHILELEEQAGLSDKELIALADKCVLLHAEQHNNFLSLCRTCHDHFDHQQLGIDFKDGKYTWLVKPELERVRMPRAGPQYGSLRGSELIYARPAYKAPPALVQHRLERYLAGISSRSKEKGRGNRGTKRKVRSLHYRVPRNF